MSASIERTRAGSFALYVDPQPGEEPDRRPFRGTFGSWLDAASSAREKFGEQIDLPGSPPRGRPPVPEDEARSARIEARVTPEQREKFERLGGPTWLRRQIERAKEADK